MSKLTTEEFIAKAKAVHGDRYDYSKVELVNYLSRTPSSSTLFLDVCLGDEVVV